MKKRILFTLILLIIGSMTFSQTALGMEAKKRESHLCDDALLEILKFAADDKKTIFLGVALCNKYTQDIATKFLELIVLGIKPTNKFCKDKKYLKSLINFLNKNYKSGKGKAITLYNQHLSDEELIKIIDAAGNKVSKFALYEKTMPTMPNPQPKLSTALVKKISMCSKLTYLELDSYKLTPEHFSILSKLKTLECLYICNSIFTEKNDNPPLTNFGTFLRSNPKLIHLSLKKSSISVVSCVWNANLYTFLPTMGKNEIIKKILCNSKKLKVLNVDLKTPGLLEKSYFTELIELKQLDIGSTKTKPFCSLVKNCEGLEYLRLFTIISNATGFGLIAKSINRLVSLKKLIITLFSSFEEPHLYTKFFKLLPDKLEHLTFFADNLPPESLTNTLLKNVRFTDFLKSIRINRRPSAMNKIIELKDETIEKIKGFDKTIILYLNLYLGEAALIQFISQLRKNKLKYRVKEFFWKPDIERGCAPHKRKMVIIQLGGYL